MNARRLDSPRTFAPLILLLMAALSTTGSAGAAEVEGLYTVVVPTNTAATDPRLDAIRRAMSEVITRVTGTRLAAQAPELAPLVADAQRYLQSFGYRSAGEAIVSFLPTEIDRLLEASNWPVWGRERPLTVLWVAVTDQFGERALLSDGSLDTGYEHSEHMAGILDAYRGELVDAAAARGIPVVLPAFDVQDMALVDVFDVWELMFETLQAASLRYGADGIAIARVRESVVGTDVEWTLELGSDRRVLPGSTFRDGIEWIADTYATQFRSIGGERRLSLRITNVTDFATYARVMSYLESVSMVASVNVQRFAGGDLLLDVTSRGDQQVLSRVLSLGNVLRPVGGGVSGANSFFGETVDFVVVGGELRR
jgi:hypothetical protein